MIKLIASDMDGTLLNAKMQISEENIAAIKKAQKLGVEFLIATGRAQAESRKLLEDAGLNTGYINLNGAMVFNTAGELIVNEPIPLEQARKIIKLLKKTDYYFEIISANHVYSDSRMRRIANVSDFLVDLNKTITFKKAVSFAGGSDEVLKINFVEDFNVLLDRPNFEVMKIMAFNPKGNSAFIPLYKELEQYKDLVATASGSVNMEINNVKAQKGIALMDYAKMQGYKQEEVAAIGDNLNDESMIRMAGIGVAMGNAVPKIKEIATFITKTNNEDGVAHTINHLLSKE